ncbi:MAG: hypothetical protein AB8G17_14675 [Gammaproteobacteria bacterium]
MTTARIIALSALLGWWSMTSLAQSSDDASQPTAEELEAAEDEDDEDIEPVIRDDVFKPSERIEADSEISFPADI